MADEAVLLQHPLSAAFPPMSSGEFQELQDSIGNIGVQNAITLFEGMVLDGWNRYRAAEDMGMSCPMVDLDPKTDPRDFVLAQNKARRHITAAQIAIATTAVYAWTPVGRPAPDKCGTECHISKTNAQLAAIAGTSTRTIRQAKTVQNDGAPEVKAAVQRGEIGLPKAAEIAKLPRAEQAAAIHQPARARHQGTPKQVPARKWRDAEIKPTEGNRSAGEASQRVDELQQLVDELQAQLVEARADNAAMARIIEATDALAAAVAEAKKYRDLEAGLNARVQSMTAQIAELKGSVKHWQARAEKAEAAHA